MFEKNQEEFLLRKLKRNEVVLFLGAGFSLNAENEKGQKLPLGSELSKLIWEIVYPHEEYESTSLPIMYELLLKSGKTFNEIQQFLNETFLVKKYSDSYHYLSNPFWYKVYTTNIDNLLDKIYFRSDQEVDVLKYPLDDYKEVDKSLGKIQHIYLNGKLPCSPNEIIFSRKQYASETNKLNQLYNQFTTDYATHTTIFLGTSLEEPLFEQYLSSRQERKSNITEYRPKSFLIDPFLSDPKIDYLKLSYNIIGIKRSSQEFLQWLEKNKSNFNNRYEVVKISNPALIDLVDNLGNEKIKHLTDQLHEFSEGFRRISIRQKSNRVGKDYLLGTSPTWNDIYNNLDAPRKITNEIYERMEKDFESDENNVKIFALLGSAGCGKSTILKRLGLSLERNGRTAFLSYSEYLPNYDSIVSIINTYEHRVALLFDNADLMLHNLSNLLDHIQQCSIKPIIVMTSRTNVFDRLTGKYNILAKIHEIEIPNLDRDEIIEVIKVLDENNLLGHMKGMTQSERIDEFEKRSQKQLLVAMREATKGDSFDNIIKSEYNQITPYEAKFLAGCVALTTEAGFTISKQDFVSFSSVTSAEALYYLNRNLRNIVLSVGKKENRLIFRHRAIAEYIINNCIDSSQLKQTYLTILTTLASEIDVKDWKSRRFALYREIINHYKVYKRFRYEIENARELYESLIPYFNNDFHLWIQYGSLEMEGKGGDLDLAENYILQAQSLKPSSTYVQNALANLYFKKARFVKMKEIGEEYRKKANEIIEPLIENPYTNNSHTYHIYCKGNYNYITRKYSNKTEIREELMELQQILEIGIASNQNNKRLLNLKEIFKKAILLTATNDKVTYPKILGDFDKN